MTTTQRSSFAQDVTRRVAYTPADLARAIDQAARSVGNERVVEIYIAQPMVLTQTLRIPAACTNGLRITGRSLLTIDCDVAFDIFANDVVFDGVQVQQKTSNQFVRLNTVSRTSIVLSNIAADILINGTGTDLTVACCTLDGAISASINTANITANKGVFSVTASTSSSQWSIVGNNLGGGIITTSASSGDHHIAGNVDYVNGGYAATDSAFQYKTIPTAGQYLVKDADGEIVGSDGFTEADIPTLAFYAWRTSMFVAGNGWFTANIGLETWQQPVPPIFSGISWSPTLSSIGTIKFGATSLTEFPLKLDGTSYGLVCEWVICPTTWVASATGYVIWGFCNASGTFASLAMPTNGIFVVVNRAANSGNFAFMCANGGVTTTVNTTIPFVVGTFYRIRIEATTDRSEVRFYIDDMTTPAGTITSNIPTGNLALVSYLVRTTANQSDMRITYAVIKMWITEVL